MHRHRHQLGEETLQSGPSGTFRSPGVSWVRSSPSRRFSCGATRSCPARPRPVSEGSCQNLAGRPEHGIEMGAWHSRATGAPSSADQTLPRSTLGSRTRATIRIWSTESQSTEISHSRARKSPIGSADTSNQRRRKTFAAPHRRQRGVARRLPIHGGSRP